jgi:plasmid replication initiation protein
MKEVEKYQLALAKSLKSKNVVMANTLTRSAQGLSLAEKRILFAAIAKMGGRFEDVKISAEEYAETFQIELNTAYEQLKSAAHNFFTRYFSLSVPDRKGVLEWKFNWLLAYAYHDNEGYVTLAFSPKVMPYLCDLEQQFTKYKLKQACALRSIYSWRLLELFEQQSSGWVLISTEDFWHSMEATATHRRSFGETRRKIIEPAVKELTEKDGWLINWQPIKSGRKVTQLRFDFKKDPQGRLDI